MAISSSSMRIFTVELSNARFHKSNPDANHVGVVKNSRTEYCLFSIYSFITLSILAILACLVEPGFGAAQYVVRVQSETRIELFVSETSQSSKLTGILRDSLGVPLPNKKIEVVASSSTARKSRTVVTTKANGEFTLPLAANSKKYGISARYDGNTFYRDTETTLDVNGVESSTRREPIPLENEATAQGSYQEEHPKEDSEPLSVLWLFIPMFSSLAVVVWVKRRVRNPKPKYEFPNDHPLSPGVETSLPIRRARKNRTSISGTIQDLHSGEAVPHVELNLVDELDNSIVLDTTSEGFFSSPSLKSGTWLIKARANGYFETTKELIIPHRGEWTNIRIHMLSMRSHALLSYREVALALLPTPQLWDIWTARETLRNSRKLIASMPLFRSLVERVERSSYSRTPPSFEEVKTIESQASSALIELSQRETDYTVTHRR